MPPHSEWVDYSDSDSPDEFEPAEQPAPVDPSHRKPAGLNSTSALQVYPKSKEQRRRQMDLLNKQDDRHVDELWIDLFSENLKYLEGEINYLRSKARKGGNIIEVRATEDPQSYRVKVFIELAKDYIREGYDKHDHIRVTLTSKDEERGQHRGGGRFEEKGQCEQKKKYLDKQELEKQEKQEKQSETNGEPGSSEVK